MRRLKTLGNLLTITGIIIIFASAIFPLIDLPQTLIRKGPSVKFDENIKYWIDIIGLPNIKRGTRFYLDLKGEDTGGLVITVLPSKNGIVIVGSSPLISYIFGTTQKEYEATPITEIESEYVVSVVSIQNNYTLTISSVWSPFDSYKTYLYPGLFTLPAGLLILYYDNILEKREREEKLALNNK
jgi:hypothetical protein